VIGRTEAKFLFRVIVTARSRCGGGRPLKTKWVTENSLTREPRSIGSANNHFNALSIVTVNNDPGDPNPPLFVTSSSGIKPTICSLVFVIPIHKHNKLVYLTKQLKNFYQKCSPSSLLLSRTRTDPPNRPLLALEVKPVHCPRSQPR
jgi:hypothetical protein